MDKLKRIEDLKKAIGDQTEFEIQFEYKESDTTLVGHPFGLIEEDELTIAVNKKKSCHCDFHTKVKPVNEDTIQMVVSFIRNKYNPNVTFLPFGNKPEAWSGERMYIEEVIDMDPEHLPETYHIVSIKTNCDMCGKSFEKGPGSPFKSVCDPCISKVPF